jgi:6,7-dimethyl-8-ribityllumazine synthase
MPEVHVGELAAKGLSFGIVVSRFNEFVTSAMLSGALDALARHGADDSSIEVAWVPGTFEIPFVAQALAQQKRFSSIICLGALIRGSTPHFDFLSSEVTKGMAEVALSEKVPVINGVITCDTLEQAIERAGTKAGNKGFLAAEAAIEMANLSRGLSRRSSVRGRRTQ